MNLEVYIDENSKKELSNGSLASELITIFELEDTPDLIAFKVGDEVVDLQTKVTNGGKVKALYLTDDSDEVKKIYRHSYSHILAQAVKRLYPNTKLAIGPATAEGFYYDFDIETPFTPEDLKAITKEMQKIVKEGHKFTREYLEPKEGLEKVKGEVYKEELLKGIDDKGEELSFYTDGEFIDLCKGPHLRSTKQVKIFKLLSVAGAYWRGDETKPMLQRIYGTAFLKKEDLTEYLWQIEEAKKRDHRKIAKELDLFSINEQVGSGLILWHPKGGAIRHVIEEYYKKKHIEAGYDMVYTPHLGRAELWETSGHLDFYKEGMYPPMELEGQTYYMKPMNCPFHSHIYKSGITSYKDLPKRLAEWGTVYRFERSGTLHGATRVRGFTQDDAHLFCRPDQMDSEIKTALNFSLSILKDFGLTDITLYLSTRPEKRVGEEKNWDMAENALESALKDSGIEYIINEGDGAFYGPKIDICVKDSLKREWQLSTVQFDFNLPERFDLNFIGEDGNKHRPMMIHRALLGSVERFFAILLEHYAGILPVWLMPTQICILPIAKNHQEYADKLYNELKKDFRVELNDSNNTLNHRIKSAQKQKIPYMLILGDDEVNSNTITIRLRNGENLKNLSIEETCATIRLAIQSGIAI